MTIDAAFNFLKIVFDKKARCWKKIPQVNSARKENIRIELTVTLINFNTKTMRPNCQSSIREVDEL